MQKTQNNIKTLLDASDISDFAISYDDIFFISCTLGKTITFWSFQSRKRFKIFTKHSGMINSVIICPKSKFIISGEDKIIKIWNIYSG